MSRAVEDGRHGRPSRRRRALWLVVAFLAVDLVAGGVVLGLLPRLTGSGTAPSTSPSTTQAPGPADALAGYPQLRGNQGWPVAAGRPWGTPCAPVRFVPGSSVTAQVRARLREVVAEAAAGGVPVVASVTVPDDRPVNAVAFELVADQSPQLPDGRPQRLFWQITTVLAPNGTSERMVGLATVMFPATTGSDPVDQRRVLRTLVARAFGLDGATRPGSGITAELASTLDRFSAADLAALRAMAGCS